MLFCAIIAVLAALLDQLSKYWVTCFIGYGETVPVLDGVLHFTHIENSGAAFGMLSEQRWVFMLVSLAAIAVFIFCIIKFKLKPGLLSLAIAFLLGGGIGNMIDRIFRGVVIDFIEVEFVDFYVFNIADSFVCVGGALLIIYMITSEIKDKQAKKQEGNTENE